MRQRVGAILFIVGVILLLKPNFNFDQMILSMNYYITQYWPAFFVIIGMFMINPKKKRRSHPR